MSIFDESKLKDEELFGGFDAADSETFAKDFAAEPFIVPDESVPKKKDEDETIKEKPEKSEDVKRTAEPEKKETPKQVKIIKPAVHKVEPDREKKTRGAALPWISAVAVLLLILFGLAYWINSIAGHDFFLQHSLVDNGETATGQIVTDIAADDTGEETIADNGIEEIETEITEPEVIETYEETVTEPAVVTLQAEQKQPKKTEKRKEPEKTVKQKPVQLKIVYKKASEREIDSAPVDAKQVTASKVVVKEEESKKTEELNTKAEKPKPVISPRGLYTIEVYSSYSYEDAKIWQDKLNRRNLNASIVTQRIKGKVLYKVRFGSFPTETDAKRMAMKLGLSRSHIDRIK